MLQLAGQKWNLRGWEFSGVLKIISPHILQAQLQVTPELREISQLFKKLHSTAPANICAEMNLLMMQPKDINGICAVITTICTQLNKDLIAWKNRNWWKGKKQQINKSGLILLPSVSRFMGQGTTKSTYRPCYKSQPGLFTNIQLTALSCLQKSTRYRKKIKCSTHKEMIINLKMKRTWL